MTSARLSASRRGFAISALSVLAAGLGGCSTMNLGGVFDDSGSSSSAGAPPPVARAADGAKIALLLPLSAQGETQKIGLALKQAAELALIDSGNPGITLLTKDTTGTGPGAEAAMQQALDEGAELVIGPLLAAEVTAVSPLAGGRGVPVIAFSSVSAVASPGVYLMSFVPEEEVANVMRHATSTGIKNVAALIPKSQYGTLAERALTTAAKAYGARIVMVERYSRSGEGVREPARRIAAAVQDPGRGIQAVFIPEGPEYLRGIGQVLEEAQFPSQRVRVLGTGLWEEQATASIRIAVGGWYAGVAPDLVRRFDQRYQQTYGAAPSRLASLAYDAVSLAIALGRNPPGQRFTPDKLTNPEGYQGVNGLFRFRPSGVIERGLAILEVTPSGPTVAAPAPARFGFGL